jgi:PhoH-like ATPase
MLNEYLLIHDSEGKIIDKYKNEKGKIIKVKYKAFDSKILGKVKARNDRQELFFDLLESDIPCVCVSGPAGSGKSFVSTSYALKELDAGKFEKIVIIRNNAVVRDVDAIGATPGDEIAKMKFHCMWVADIVSDFYLDNLLNQNKIELAYIGTLRSRSFSNCLILVNESQNLTSNLARLVISRVGENSKIIWDFDVEQTDKNSYSKDNGMLALVEGLKGQPLVGMVELLDVERSEVAKLASLIK